MIEERCENCRFYSELKMHKRYLQKIEENGVVSGWEIATKRNLFVDSHCCLMFVKVGNDPYVVETTPNDRCECFEERS